jgi:FkbM family methyltransferase
VRAETIKRNNLENVSLVHAAVSDESGEVRLKVKGSFGRDLGGASHLVASSDVRATAVPAVRIDDAVPGSAQVTVLHLDVEGHEPLALTGAMETIRRCRPIIVLETDVSGDLKAALKALGYRRRGHVGVNTIRAVAPPAVKPKKPSTCSASRGKSADCWADPECLDCWCCRRGLNSGPLPYQGSALPLSYGSAGPP